MGRRGSKVVGEKGTRWTAVGTREVDWVWDHLLGCPINSGLYVGRGSAFEIKNRE